MAWPPNLPPATRANTTPQQDAHPSDHNLIAGALAAVVPRAGYGFRCHRPDTTFSIAPTTNRDFLPGEEVFRHGFTVGTAAYVFDGAARTGFIIVAGANWSQNGEGIRRVSVLINGVEAAGCHIQSTSSGGRKHQAVYIGALDPGDTVALQVWHNASVAVDLAAGDGTFLSAAPGWAE